MRDKNRWEELVRLARLGDTQGMERLGDWFRRRLPGYYLKMEAGWERDPSGRMEEFFGFLLENREIALNAGAGIMWYIRAAAFGNEHAAKLISEHKYWEELSLLPELFFYPGMDFRVNFSGEILRKAGLVSFSENQTYCLKSLDSDGVFCAETKGGYEGPDEDGFGMEEFYNFYRFDEFFCEIESLRERSRRDYRNNQERYARMRTEKKEALQKQRESYWKKGRASKVAKRYSRLPSEYTGAMIRDGVLKRYYGGTGRKRYEIPQTVTRIGLKAFYADEGLQEIVVPETVQCIGQKAFCTCRALKRLILPDHLHSLGGGLCMDSRSLEEIRLPSHLEELPAYMFQYNNSMKHIELPENLKKIGECCFSYCAVRDVILPEGLEEISQQAFERSAISEIHIPRNVKIGQEAFYGCEELKKVVIAEGIKRIEEGTFKSCKKLETVILPGSLREIEECCFSYCDSLQKIVIPESVEQISYSVFPKGITIYGKKGSEAERYARNNKHPFRRIASSTTKTVKSIFSLPCP